MKLRPVFAAALVLLGLSVAGCSAAPSPAPTASVTFADEDEAFAAAEATYRAYVDALNHVDLSDPRTFEAVYELTSGATNSEARKSLSQMHADGWKVSGSTNITLLEPRAIGSAELSRVELYVCIDVSNIRVVDALGANMVSPDRGDTQTLLVSVQRAAMASVHSITARDEGPTCAG